MISSLEVWTAASGRLRLTPTQIHGTRTSAPLTLTLRIAAVSQTALLSAASPSRALRSLPLSVMMTGDLWWGNGGLYDRGMYGGFWSSTPYAYITSHYLYFISTNVNSKNGSHKPSGFMLRCVARFICVFLPELSAAFLFRLCCRGIITGSVVISTIEVRTATSGHLRLTPTLIHGPCTSAPLALTLSITAVSQTASCSAASPKPNKSRHT